MPNTSHTTPTDEPIIDLTLVDDPENGQAFYVNGKVAHYGDVWDQPIHVSFFTQHIPNNSLVRLSLLPVPFSYQFDEWPSDVKDLFKYPSRADEFLEVKQCPHCDEVIS